MSTQADIPGEHFGRKGTEPGFDEIRITSSGRGTRKNPSFRKRGSQGYEEQFSTNLKLWTSLARVALDVAFFTSWFYILWYLK